MIAFAIKNNNLQIPHFWCEPQDLQWHQNRSRFIANVLHSFQWSSTLAHGTETHDKWLLLCRLWNWKFFQAQDEHSVFNKKEEREKEEEKGGEVPVNFIKVTWDERGVLIDTLWFF